MGLFALAWKNLRRRPARSLLTTMGLGIAIAAVVALVGVSQSMESSFLDLYTRRGADLVVQRKGGTIQLTKGIEHSYCDRVRQIPGVRQVIGCLMDMISFEEQNLFLVLVNGWEPNSPVIEHVNPTAGRRLRPTDQRQVMLGHVLATNLHKQVGDPITLYGREFHVVGVFESFSVYENGAVFMQLAELQKEMDRPGQITGFVVHCYDRSAENVAQIRKQVEALDPSLVALPSAEFVNALSQMKLTRTMSWVMSLIALAIGALGVLNTMAMSVFERRGELAALRAMGWQRQRVMRLVVCEALVLSCGGAIAGTAIGLGAIEFIARWPVTAGIVQGQFSWRIIGEGCAIALLMGLVGSLYPAWRCARQSIVDGLRAV